MIQDLIKAQLSYAIHQLFGLEIKPEVIVIEKTAANFEGDFTYVVFPLLKASRKNPEQTAETLGEFLLQHFPELASFQVVKGFLNLDNPIAVGAGQTKPKVEEIKMPKLKTIK